MQRDQTVPIRASSDEKIGFEKFAKEHKRSVSQLFRDSIDIIMRNPTLLDPTGETARLLTDIDRVERVNTQWNKLIIEVFKEQNDRLDFIEKKIDSLLRKDGKIVKPTKKKKLGDLVDG